MISVQICPIIQDFDNCGFLNDYRLHLVFNFLSRSTLSVLGEFYLITSGCEYSSDWNLE